MPDNWWLKLKVQLQSTRLTILLSVVSLFLLFNSIYLQQLADKRQYQQEKLQEAMDLVTYHPRPLSSLPGWLFHKTLYSHLLAGLKSIPVAVHFQSMTSEAIPDEVKRISISSDSTNETRSELSSIKLKKARNHEKTLTRLSGDLPVSDNNSPVAIINSLLDQFNEFSPCVWRQGKILQDDQQHMQFEWLVVTPCERFKLMTLKLTVLSPGRLVLLNSALLLLIVALIFTMVVPLLNENTEAGAELKVMQSSLKQLNTTSSQVISPPDNTAYHLYAVTEEQIPEASRVFERLSHRHHLSVIEMLPKPELNIETPKLKSTLLAYRIQLAAKDFRQWSNFIRQLEEKYPQWLIKNCQYAESASNEKNKQPVSVGTLDVYLLCTQKKLRFG